MSTPSDRIDDALADLQQALIRAAKAGPYTPDLQDKLDDVTLLLQTMEGNLQLDTQQAILDALSGSNAELKKLNQDIEIFTNKLGKAAAKIKRVSDTVATVVSVVGAVVSAGVI